MLGMVLIDYAKVLRNITPRAIYYGNFEAGRAKQGSAPHVKAPVIDVTSFANLQAWTTAAQAFLNGGNTNLLKNLIAQTNPQLAEDLNQFALSILMCRGQQLNRDLDVDNLKTQIVNLQSQTIQAQLRPLLEQIQQKLAPFNSQNTINGIRAVEWCVVNGLIQQGYTFLQETLKSYVIEHVFAGDAALETLLLKREVRDAASSALDGNTHLKISTKLPNSIVGKGAKAILLEHLVASLHISTYYNELTARGRGLRNDINHCGFKDNYGQPNDLKSDLERLLVNVKLCLSIA
jgi:hypothetical protein